MSWRTSRGRFGSKESVREILVIPNNCNKKGVIASQLTEISEFLNLLLNKQTYAIALIFGGAFILRYYNSIGVSIELRPSDVAWIFVAAFIAGSYILTIVSLIFLMPGKILGSMVKKNKIIQYGLCIYRGEGKAKENQFILGSTIAPFIVNSIFLTLLAVTATDSTNACKAECWFCYACVFSWNTVILIFWFLLAIIWVVWLRKATRQFAEKIDLVISFIELFIMPTFSSLFAILILSFSLLMIDFKELQIGIANLIVVAVMIGTSTIAIGTKELHSGREDSTLRGYRVEIIFVVAFLVVLFQISELGNRVSYAVAKIVGIRSDIPITYILDDKGMQAMQQAGESSCYTESAPSIIKRATKLSGLGNDYVLECPNSESKSKFTIPKKYVLMAIVENEKSAQATAQIQRGKNL